MPLPEFVKKHVDKKVGTYCDKKVSVHLRNQLRITYKIRGNSVTLFEERAPWRKELKDWTSLPVAQMRYSDETGKWTLYCSDRNNKWHLYTDIDFDTELDEILGEIDRDPTGIFWG